MKKLLLAAALALLATSANGANVKFPMNTMVGKWCQTAVQGADGSAYDLFERKKDCADLIVGRDGSLITTEDDCRVLSVKYDDESFPFLVRYSCVHGSGRKSVRTVGVATKARGEYLMIDWRSIDR